MLGVDSTLGAYNHWVYRSRIPLRYRNDLERLFFFHPEQARHRERIELAVERYSVPTIHIAGDTVALSFQKKGIGQALHLLSDAGPDARLLGALLYVRDEPQRISLVHLALRNAVRNRPEAVARLFSDLIAILRRIRGVRELFVFYSGTRLRVTQ